MFCHKCGNQISEDAGFCRSCGAKLITDGEVQQPVSVHNEGYNYSQSAAGKASVSIWMVTAVIVAIIAIIGAVICVTNGVFVHPATGDKYADIVRNSKLGGYPGATIGEALDKLLSNAKWESIAGDDGNGYVNIKGGVLYLEKEVDVAIQFKINSGEDELEINAFELNGVPQSFYILWELLERSYEGTEKTSEASSGNAGSQYPTEVLYIGEPESPLSSWLGSPVRLLHDAFGAPNYEDSFQGGYYYAYDDMTFFYYYPENGDSEITYIVVTTPSKCEMSDITLNRTRHELVSELGEPTNEFSGYAHEELGIYGYCMEYELQYSTCRLIINEYTDEVEYVMLYQ